ncbi:MAG: endonuclease, partial [Oscillospiraceae bacterium]|nr:endonuclease [Oscillospiraceae bacterium]
FNQMFPKTEEKYPIFTAELWKPGVLEESALPEGWSYVFDDSVPTCRLLNKPYDKESAQHYVIDGFIISPNVELVSVGTVDAGFEFSDHNPVVMEIVLK